MWRRQVAIGVVLGLVVLHGSSRAQRLVWHDRNVVRTLMIPADSGHSLIRLRVTQRLEYALTLSGVFFINWERDHNNNHMMVIQDILYQCKGETEKRFRFTQKLVHHLGIQYFFDSIARFHIDDNQLETRLECRIRKNHGCFLSALFSTRLFNSYLISANDSGQVIRTLASSFMTPLTGLFSGGIQFKWPLFGSLNIGITSAKLTWIRDRSIYESLEVTTYYGVPQEKRYLFEYGLSIQLLINHDLLKWLHWDCDLIIFKNTNLPPDVSVKNNLGFRLTKFLKARIQTRLYYEECVSKKVQLENIVSMGLVVVL
jgi:hypothetical protein